MPGIRIHRTDNRRPPFDVVSSMLSFGSPILLSEAVSALVATGLDPVIGFLNTDRDDRPSLTLDLVEQIRPLIVGQIVMEIVRRHRLLSEHGRRDEDCGVCCSQRRAGRSFWIVMSAGCCRRPGRAAGLRGYVAAGSVSSGSDAGVLGGGPHPGVRRSVMASTVLTFMASRGTRRGRWSSLTCGRKVTRSSAVVLVCAVAPEDLDDMISRMEDMIDPRTDAVHLLSTCDLLVPAGGPQPDRRDPDEPYWAVL
ncbi:MAG: CRISPR-associated endonuclease Cas1 [Pseudonocardiaceae bacterium]